MSGELHFFTHVLKAGGTSVEVQLRKALGIRHMGVDPPVGWIYTPEDLAFDRRVNPLARSFSSHWLRPFVSFGPLDSQIVWHTMLRSPLDRYRSHRQHHVERFGNRESFEEWSDHPTHSNWQTRQIARGEDLEAARQILTERYRFVGLLERFEESLVLLWDALGLDLNLLHFSGERHNPGRSDRVARRVREELALHEDRVRQQNALDVQLYRVVSEQLFPEHVARYGAERLREEVAAAHARSASLRSHARSWSHLAFRRLVQLPVMRVRKRQAIRSGREDVRQ